MYITKRNPGEDIAQNELNTIKRARIVLRLKTVFVIREILEV